MKKKEEHPAEEPPAHIPSATPSHQRLEKLRADANSCALMSGRKPTERGASCSDAWRNSLHSRRLSLNRL